MCPNIAESIVIDYSTAIQHW